MPTQEQIAGTGCQAARSEASDASDAGLQVASAAADGTPQFPPPPIAERIYGIADGLAAFQAAQSEQASLWMIGQVARLVDAQNGYWMGAVRVLEQASDPLQGWRPRVIRYLEPLPDDATYTRERVRSLNKGQTIDEATVAQARLAGQWRARRLRDLVSPQWFDSQTYQGYLARSVHDSLTVAVPVSASAEVYYGFLRMRPDEPFTEQQRDTAFHALRSLMWFHRQLLLSEGLLVSANPLSPVEKRVLTMLLTDQSEKVIAAHLGLSPATLHTYVKGVLRKFNVSGRNGLLALWLGKAR